MSLSSLPPSLPPQTFYEPQCVTRAVTSPEAVGLVEDLPSRSPLSREGGEASSGVRQMPRQKHARSAVGAPPGHQGTGAWGEGEWEKGSQKSPSAPVCSCSWGGCKHTVTRIHSGAWEIQTLFQTALRLPKSQGSVSKEEGESRWQLPTRKFIVRKESVPVQELHVCAVLCTRPIVAVSWWCRGLEWGRWAKGHPRSSGS